MNRQDFAKITLPDAPGVYLFKKGKEILYIGKATSLRERVKSYFAADLIAARGPLLVDMVYLADQIECIRTDSALEAVILEANLIKERQPRYNTMEKDDKSYNYVVITKEIFPRVLVERGTNIDFKAKKLSGGEKLSDIFGPFVNGLQLKDAMKIIRRIFPFLDRPADSAGYGFYREIGLAPDLSGAEARKEYARTIRHIRLFFKGRKKSIIAALEKDMKLFAKARQFELAGGAKRKIFALRHIEDIALLKRSFDSADNWGETAGMRKPFRIEAYDAAHIAGAANVGVMTVVEGGKANKAEYRKFKIRESTGNDIAALGEMLRRRLRHGEWRLPDMIVVDGAAAQKNMAEKILGEAKLAVPVVAVTKDERHRPKAITGREDLVEKRKKEILLANAEAHRFAVAFHRKSRSKRFI
ncbi:MAG: hypothetical protein KGH93_01620 [Patescibacteria group bacterium]|nr:hypothetical protein [Patescibacteria group bacterium]MDE1945880.1 hypothetical protein [Patescibacteria group bacterium]